MTGVAAVVGTRITRVRKGDLRRLFSDWEMVTRLFPVLGLPSTASLDRPFPCILPGHAGHSARLSRNGRNATVYRDERTSLGTSVYTLADVFRFRYTGLTSKMRGPMLAAWNLRLLAEAGILEAVHVELPPLPGMASSDVRKVHERLTLLFGVRWTYETGEQPVPLSHRFVGSWCGVTERAASAAIKELLRRDIIHIADSAPGRFGKPMALFMPGPAPPKEPHPTLHIPDHQEHSRE